MKQPAVYIVTNRKDGTLYTGVTSDLFVRIYQHRHGTYDGFSKRYNCTRLVYFEQHADMTSAITYEKKLKHLARAKKIAIIMRNNPA